MALLCPREPSRTLLPMASASLPRRRRQKSSSATARCALLGCLGLASAGLLLSAVRVARLSSAAALKGRDPLAPPGPPHPPRGATKGGVGGGDTTAAIPDHHHAAHVEADAHILDHWKDRGAQVPPLSDAQHDGPNVPRNEGSGNTTSITTRTNTNSTTKRFIAFHGIASGQGAGNIISGLLAAHLYGVEFDRIVCLTEGMRNFWLAYEAIHPDSLRHCPWLAEHRPPTRGSRNTFDVLTYAPPPNECALREVLQSNETVVYMGGNTYPRWPVTPKDFFVRYYRPRATLRPYLPDPQPEIVVHLRLEDGRQDKRQGLDEGSLKALGELLPRNETYLVTNNVVWYDYFEKNYGWRHPQWNVVLHSAGMGLWGGRGVTSDRDRDTAIQNLQMWSDWNTILMAKKVYHTHSDFSVSAIHWMDLESKSIQGYDSSANQLRLIDESWRVSWKEEGVTPPLRDRTVDGTGIAKLRCDKPLSLAPLFGNDASVQILT